MSRINVTFVVTGFPTEDNPSHGVFNKRAADLLSEYVDISVVQLRVLMPGRKVLSLVSEDPYKHYVLSAPYLPPKPFFICKQLSLYKKFGGNRLNSLLLHTNIIHSVGASFAGALGSLWAENYRKRNIIQLIGTDVNSELSELRNLRCFKDLPKFTYGVGANTYALKQKYEELIPGSENVNVVYRGINVEDYNFSFTDSDKIKFLFLGGLPDYKHVESGKNLKGGITLMQAWKHKEDELFKSGCELIFAGPDSDSDEAVKWKDSLNNPSIVQLKGSLTPEQVLEELKSSHILLIPSLEEGMPNVALEGGASGKCIIASNVGGLPELITDNETGLLIKPGSTEDLGKAMISISKNLVRAKEIGLNLRKRIEADFDFKNFALGYLNLYEKALTIPIRS